MSGSTKTTASLATVAVTSMAARPAIKDCPSPTYNRDTWPSMGARRLRAPRSSSSSAIASSCTRMPASRARVAGGISGRSGATSSAAKVVLISATRSRDRCHSACRACKSSSLRLMRSWDWLNSNSRSAAAARGPVPSDARARARLKRALNRSAPTRSVANRTSSSMTLSRKSDSSYDDRNKSPSRRMRRFASVPAASCWAKACTRA